MDKQRFKLLRYELKTMCTQDQLADLHALCEKSLINNKRIPIPKTFDINQTNSDWLNNEGIPEPIRNTIIRDFVDYWLLDGAKKSEKGWQQAFRRNPVVKRAITNFKHNQNKPANKHQSTEVLAQSLNLQARPGESWDDFNRRVQVASRQH